MRSRGQVKPFRAQNMHISSIHHNRVWMDDRQIILLDVDAKTTLDAPTKRRCRDHVGPRATQAVSYRDEKSKWEKERASKRDIMIGRRAGQRLRQPITMLLLQTCSASGFFSGLERTRPQALIRWTIVYGDFPVFSQTERGKFASGTRNR